MALSISAVQVTMSIVAGALMDRLGRRVLLMVSMLGAAASLVCIGTSITASFAQYHMCLQGTFSIFTRTTTKQAMWSHCCR